MATNNAVNVGLSGQTGTGSFVGTISPTMVTPNLGVVSGTSLAFSPTTGGIIGTTTNNVASAGIVGEVMSSTVLFASGIGMTSSANTDITSITLSAGDWDVWGNITIVFSVTAGTTQVAGWVNNTSATKPDGSLNPDLNNVSQSQIGFSIFPQQFTLSTSTSLFLSGLAIFAAGTATGSGTIFARRKR